MTPTSLNHLCSEMNGYIFHSFTRSDLITTEVYMLVRRAINVLCYEFGSTLEVSETTDIAFWNGKTRISNLVITVDYYPVEFSYMAETLEIHLKCHEGLFVVLPVSSDSMFGEYCKEISKICLKR